MLLLISVLISSSALSYTGCLIIRGEDWQCQVDVESKQGSFEIISNLIKNHWNTYEREGHIYLS